VTFSLALWIFSLLCYDMAFYFLFFGLLNVPFAIFIPLRNDVALRCGVLLPPALAYLAPALCPEQFVLQGDPLYILLEAIVYLYYIVALFTFCHAVPS
jgi:hypothetical protein